MDQRKPIAGRRSCVLYAVILAALALIVAGAGLVLVVRPELDRRRQAEVRLEQAETHYQAGVAFQNVGDWEAAEAEFKQTIALDPDYKDVQSRLAEVKDKLAKSEATATAVAVAQVEQAQAEAQATAAAAPTATAQALEVHYQKGLGYMSMERWEEARTELEQVFEVDPSYKEVQARWMEVESEITKLTSTSTPTPSVVRSSFEGTNKEGWTTISYFEGSNTTTTSDGALTNHGTGGNGGGTNNGHLGWTDPDSGASYYVAPSRYHGNWRGYSELRLDLRSSGGDYFTSGHGMHGGDILLVSGYATAQRLLPCRPPGSWRTFIIPLTDSGEWILGGGATSLNDVLVDVTDFQIRAEYGVNKDESGLDNVELVR